jgi:dihydrolipoamide dehydrogenase
MMAHKDATVDANVSGVAFLFKKNKIDAFRGTGRIVARQGRGHGRGRQDAADRGGKNIVIATGSDVAGIPGVEVEIDEKVIVSSTGALSLDKVPAISWWSAGA